MPSPFNVSINTALRSLHSVCKGGFIKDGADHLKDSPIQRFFCWLFGMSVDGMQAKETCLLTQTHQIVRSIVNAKRSSNGYCCEAIFGRARFSIKETLWFGQQGIEIQDIRTGQKLVSEEVTFDELRKQALISYIKEQRNRHHVPIDLSEFNFTYLDLKEIDFKDTLLSQKNLEAIVACGGDLRGATLAEGINATELQLQQVQMDKNIAIQLTNAGANPEAMRVHYFKCDLLEVLNVYSQYVASLVVASTSRDVDNKVGQEIFDTHRSVMRFVREFETAHITRLERALKFGVGNCVEMATICKKMLDLYLGNSLKGLDYEGFHLEISVIEAFPTFDHAVVKVAGSFQDLFFNYIADPWSEKGKAWKYDDAVNYFRNNMPDEDAKEIWFDKHIENTIWNDELYTSKAKQVFDKLDVKNGLDRSFEKSKSHFIGAQGG